MAKKPAAAVPEPAAPVQGIPLDQAIAQAYAHWNAGQADQAERLCQQVLGVWPEHVDALHLLGLVAYGHGNLALAIDFLRRACATPRAPALFLSNLAEMCRQSGLLAEAEKMARRAIALDSRLDAGWSNLGIILQEMGRLEDSLECLRRVIERNPDSPENHNNLGNTLNRLGRLAEARHHYDRAVALRPTYSEARSNLAKLLSDLGDLTGAAAQARAAIEHNPRNADAYINAAAIAQAADRKDEAARWIDNLLSFAPTHAGALMARARALKEEGDLEGAERVVRQAIAGASENSEAYDVLGQVLMDMARTDEAFAAFDRAAALPAAQPETPLVSRAVALMELGRPDEAKALFDAALAVNPRSASIWFNSCEVRKFTAQDPGIVRMEELLAQADRNGMAMADRAMLHFALGKAWLDADESERAFAHLAEGNRLKRATITFDIGAAERWIEDIARVFSADLLAQFKGSGDPSDRPIFVVGMPRSGTTLVEQILASHPRIAGAGELRLLQGMVDRITGPDGRRLDFPEMAHHLVAEDLARLGRHYVGRIASLAQGRPHVVDKMPANFLYAGLIHLILPNARIIHCRRDAADTCLSCYTKLFSGEQKFTYDLGELGRFHRAYDGLMEHWRTILPADRFLEIDYERVVGSLETESRRMIDFCGLDWDEACLSFHQTGRPIRTASVNQVRQPIYTGSVGRWRRHQVPLSPLLEALGRQ